MTEKNTFHILIVHNEYQYAGGEDTVVRQDAALLEKHGHRVFFYTRNNDELKSFTGLQKLFLPFTTIFSLKSYREIRKIIREQKIELVHVHNTLPLISYSAYYAAKREGCRLIQTIHNFRLVCPNALFYRDGHICEDCLNKGLLCGVKHRCYRGSKTQTAMVALMLKLHRMFGTFKKPDAYITLTGFNKEKISAVVPAEKIHVKPNYLSFNSEIGQKEDAVFTGSFSDLKNTSFFLYASRIEKVKGIFVLLEAFSVLPEQKLLILGTGPDEAAVKDYIARKKLTNIIFAGFTPHEKALQLMAHAKAMIFPSLWYEGFPMTIVESLSRSLPVIASDTPNIASVISHQKNGLLFKTGSSDALIHAITEFLQLSPEDSLLMKEAARESYLKSFTEEIIYKKLIDIYTTS